MPNFKNANNVGTHTGLFTSLHKVVKMLGGAHCFFFKNLCLFYFLEVLQIKQLEALGGQFYGSTSG